MNQTPSNNYVRSLAPKVFAAYSLLYLLFFAPVLFSNRLLAPGDGIIYFAPNFASTRQFWEQLIWGGYPSVADSQLMLWYPPAILFSLFGSSGYQPFILLAYVMASSFTFGFVFSLTRSRLAAAISGCVFGLSGFMVAHVGHATMIHAAAWLPLTIWSLHELTKTGKHRHWFVIGALSIALNALAGHPQIFAYTITLAVVYAIINGSFAAASRVRYFVMVGAMLVLGCAVATVQLWPTTELANLSWRASLNFSEFVAYELPLRQLPVLLFPYLYGGSPGSFYGLSYFGAWPSSADGWGAGELSGYAGLLTLLLAGVGVVACWQRREVRFWLIVAVVALLLTLGESTPFARIIFHVPGLNKFRVPARHFLELTFSLGILAGFGTSSLQRADVSAQKLLRILMSVLVAILLCVLSLILFASKINELAIQRLGHTISLKPWSNMALLVPVIVLIVASIVVWQWSRSPQSPAWRALLTIVMLVDLGSFGWFCEWHYRSPYKAYLREPQAAEELRNELLNSKQRLLPIRGGTGRVNELPPNLSKIWRIPSASGYGPFILSRVSRLLTMPPHGSVDESWRDPSNEALNLMAVRYVTLPPEQIGPTHTKDSQGINWADNDLAVDLGSGCNPNNPPTYDLSLAQPIHASSLGIVGALACSVQIKNGVEVLRLTVTDQNGKSDSYPLEAGRDFSEWAFDCSDVTPAMQHARAQVFRNYKSKHGAINCEAHDYVTRIQLNNPVDIKRITLSWTGPAGTFALKKVTSIDGQSSMPLSSSIGSLSDTTRWRQVGQIDASNSGYGNEVASEDQGVGLVFENLQARPRAWTVSEVITLPEEAVFNAVRSSRLPDGRLFEPAKMALVERPLALETSADASASATVTSSNSSVMEVKTSSNTATFLVTSDVLYPGWRAYVDGQTAEIYQTDYALRGVAVPEGNHVVRFEFHPRRFYEGAVVSALALVLLAVSYLVFASNKRFLIATRQRLVR